MFLDELARVLRLNVPADQKIKLAQAETEKIMLAEQELERQRIIALRTRFRGQEREEGEADINWFSDEQIIDLGVARNNKLIWDRGGKALYVTHFHANQDNTRIRFNNIASPYYRMHRGYIKNNFSKIYLTNTAQSGKTLQFIVSSRDFAEFHLQAGADIQNVYDEIVTSRGLLDVLKLNSIRAATTPTIYNVTITTANTEYPQALPAMTKRFKVVLADGATFRLAYVAGKVATPTAPYWTQPANIPYEEKIGLYLSGITLYLASPAATKIAQIVCWV